MKKKEEKLQKLKYENNNNNNNNNTNNYNNTTEELNENDDQYFSIQITIPSGKERTLKVHVDDDPFEIADNFCKVYGMKDEIKERLARTIIKFMEIYLKNEKINNDDIITSENNQISQNNYNLEDL